MSEVKEKHIETLSDVTVRFAGDSGDGMQLTGSQFSDTTAWVGNDLNTLPDKYLLSHHLHITLEFRHYNKIRDIFLAFLIL